MAVTPSSNSKGAAPNKWLPANGPDYDIVDQSIIDARTRGWIAKVFVGFGVAALVVTGTISLVTGRTMLVLAVWGVVGPLFGAISGYYFRSDRKDSG